MNLTVYKELLSRFLSSTERQVLDVFSNFKGAHRDDEFVYIPGTRKDRVLLVAHADTAGPTREPIWLGDAAVTDLWGTWGGRTIVLGADDRAGCAMMYNVFNGDHSLLITTGEEKGCIGARAAVKAIGEELAKHQFAVQVDRQGDRQAVFYSVGTEAFKKYIMGKLDQYDYERVPWFKEPGSYTDIAHICEEISICGVNLSAGYVNQHSAQEILLLGAWLHTRTVLRRLLQQPHMPKFVLPKVRYQPVKTAYGTGHVYDPPNGQAQTYGETATATRMYDTGVTDPNDKAVVKLKPGTGKQPLMVQFRNVLMPVHALSKNQRKAISKRIYKDWSRGRLTMAEAYQLLVQIAPDKLSMLPVRKVTEEERKGFDVGKHWERPVQQVVGPVRPRSMIGGTSWEPREVKLIEAGKKMCAHGTEEGRYCERCVGVVGLSSSTLSHVAKPKCPHGTPYSEVCDICSGIIGDVSLVRGIKCEHGVLLDELCQTCKEESYPETEEVIAEVVESQSEPIERRSLSPKAGELDFDGVSPSCMTDGFMVEEGESPFHIDH